jgi:hypothetical protein
MSGIGRKKCSVLLNVFFSQKHAPFYFLYMTVLRSIFELPEQKSFSCSRQLCFISIDFLTIDSSDHSSPAYSCNVIRVCCLDTKITMQLSTTREANIVRPLDSFPAFHGTRRFNTEFTRALHLFLS